MSAESFKQQLQNHQLLDKNMTRGLATRHHFPLWHQLKRSRFKGIILAFIAIAVVLCFFYLRPWRIKWCSSTTLFSKVFVKQNQNLTLVILPKELADEKGAYCLDGGPPSYYIREAKSNSTRHSWLVTLQGGGWCWNASDCYNRSLGPLGSSYKLPAQTPFYGIMSANYTVNPEFYDWNMVMINYCDGASFSGNLEAPVRYNNTAVYYRGARVLKLVMAYLIKTTGLRVAKKVILSGVSAGGLAVYLHVDQIRSIFPEKVNFHGIVDGGFFLDEKNISNYLHYRAHMRQIFAMQLVEDSLNRGCLFAEGIDEWKCFFAEYTYPFIKTPLFIINSAYDYWQQWFILDLRCHPLQCPDKLKYLKRHHTIFLQEIQRVYHHPNDGMFISSCYAHSHAFHDSTWTSYKVGGKSAREAVGDWYFGRTPPERSRYTDCNTKYNCNPTCANSWTLEFYKNTTDRMKNTTSDFFYSPHKSDHLYVKK
ncbi:uncharacterized protein [Asterias amurensis]|uniref:uncharacterized protein n=1 Tax=Asterias amurensis TaxID=7602 RepID=UPI003AB8A0CC